MSQDRVEEHFPTYSGRRRQSSPSMTAGISQEMLRCPPRKEVDLEAVKDKIKKKKQTKPEPEIGGETVADNAANQEPEDVKPVIKKEIPEIVLNLEEEDDIIVVKIPRKKNLTVLPNRTRNVAADASGSNEPGHQAIPRNASETPEPLPPPTRISTEQQPSLPNPQTFSTPVSNGQGSGTPAVLPMPQVPFAPRGCSTPELFSSPMSTPLSTQIPSTSRTYLAPQVPLAEPPASFVSGGQHENRSIGDACNNNAAPVENQNSQKTTNAGQPESQGSTDDVEILGPTRGTFEISSRGIELRFPPEILPDTVVHVTMTRGNSLGLPMAQPNMTYKYEKAGRSLSSHAGRSNSTSSTEGDNRKRTSESEEDRRERKKSRQSTSQTRDHKSHSHHRHHSSHSKKSQHKSSSGHRDRRSHEHRSSSGHNEKRSHERSSSSRHTEGESQSRSSSGHTEKGMQESRSSSGDKDKTAQPGGSSGDVGRPIREHQNSSRPDMEKDNETNKKKGPVFRTEVELICIINKCEECGKQFKTRREAVDHKKTKHKLKHCPVCFLLLSTTGNAWKDHISKEHSKGQDETAACHFCKRSFDFGGLYQHVGRAHLLRHEEKGVLKRDINGPPVLLPNAPVAAQIPIPILINRQATATVTAPAPQRPAVAASNTQTRAQMPKPPTASGKRVRF